MCLYRNKTTGTRACTMLQKLSVAYMQCNELGVMHGGVKNGGGGERKEKKKPIMNALRGNMRVKAEK
jgi:hypothetical protein